MSESPKQTYPLRNTLTGATVHVAPEALQQYLSATVPKSGTSLFEPLKDLPGFKYNVQGGIEHTVIPKTNAHEVARRMFEDGYQYSLALGPQDPRWELARKSEQRRLETSIAAQEGGMGTFASRALSVASQPLTIATGGKMGWTQFEDFLGGEGSAQARADRAASHYWQQLGGTFAGVALLGSMPIPGAGKMGGFLARGGQAGEAAVNVSNLFELSTAAAQGARALVTGSPTFVKSLAGTLGGAAVAEIPIGIALASADIVDSNKQWTAQAVLADGIGIAAMGMGAALVGGTALAGLRAGLSGGKAGMAGIGGMLKNFAIRSAAGNVVRANTSLGNLHPVKSVIIQQGAIEAARFFTRMGSKTGSSRFMRFLMGDRIDNYVQYATTNKQLLTHGLNPDLLDDAALARNIEVLGQNISDPNLGAILDKAMRGAESGQLRASLDQARELAGVLAGAESSYKNIRWRAPEGVQYTSSFSGDLFNAFREAARAVDATNPKLAKDILQISNTVARQSDPNALIQALNVRSMLVNEGELMGMAARNYIDNAIAKGTGGNEAILKGLKAIDELGVVTQGSSPGMGSGRFQEWLKNPTAPTANADFGSMKEAVNQINLHYGALERAGLVTERAGGTPFSPKWGAGTTPGHAKDFMARRLKKLEKAGFEEGLDALTALNSTRRLLLRDASPMIPKKPALVQEELLALQVHSLTDFKVRMQRTLRASLNAGAATATGHLTGVLAIRNIASHQDKVNEFLRNRDIVLQAGASPEQALAVVAAASQEVSKLDIELATHLGQTMMAATAYLLQHMPRSDDNAPDEFSDAEMESWLERVGALEDPISVIASAADGSVTHEAVDAVRTVYPSVYTDMMLDIVDFVQREPKSLNQRFLIGLDTFMGGTLGALDGPSILQPPYAQTAAQAQALGAVGLQRFQQAAAQATAAQKVGAL